MFRRIASSLLAAARSGHSRDSADTGSTATSANNSPWDNSDPAWTIGERQSYRSGFLSAFQTQFPRSAAHSSRAVLSSAVEPGASGNLTGPADGGGAAALFNPGATTAGASPLGAAGSGLSAGTSPTSGITDAMIAADVLKYDTSGSLGYSSVLAILQDAAAGGMTASEFSSLQSFASELNKSGGIAVSPYVQQITDDVVFGNSANMTWNGGSSVATPLGNLTATSTQTQALELIGTWFLGTNLPSASVSAIGEANYSPTYKASTLPLYGASGAPSYTDVNQGYLGDCYFLSSLGEVALQDPAEIVKNITNNGNGTYGVKFYVNGQPDYVTVNEQLPVMGGGYHWANGSTLEFANGTTDNWVALYEKAYAQLNAQTAAPHGTALHSASNSYQGIDLGNGSALTLITGESESPTQLFAGESSTSLASILANTAAAFSAGEEVLMSTSGTSNGNLVASHMYMVTGINAATDSFTIHNPWGSSYSGPLAMTFTESIQQLAANNCTLWVTSGHVSA